MPGISPTNQLGDSFYGSQNVPTLENNSQDKVYRLNHKLVVLRPVVRFAACPRLELDGSYDPDGWNPF